MGEGGSETKRQQFQVKDVQPLKPEERTERHTDTPTAYKEPRIVPYLGRHSDRDPLGKRE